MVELQTADFGMRNEPQESDAGWSERSGGRESELRNPINPQSAFCNPHCRHVARSIALIVVERSSHWVVSVWSCFRPAAVSE